MQYEHFKSELAIFRLAPSAASRRFSLLVNFVSTVAHHYPQEAGGFPAELMGVLDTHAAVLESETRTALVKVRRRAVTRVCGCVLTLAFRR